MLFKIIDISTIGEENLKKYQSLISNTLPGKSQLLFE